MCMRCYLKKNLVIHDMLVQTVGIEEVDYAIFTELQMVQFSILVHCRKYVFVFVLFFLSSLLIFYLALFFVAWSTHNSTPHPPTGVNAQRSSSKTSTTESMRSPVRSQAATMCGANSAHRKYAGGASIRVMGRPS